MTKNKDKIDPNHLYQRYYAEDFNHLDKRVITGLQKGMFAKKGLEALSSLVDME